MAGSSRPPSNHSRPFRLRDDEDLAVTQASFESLALTPSVGSQRYQVSLSSYQVPDPIYIQQHLGGADPSTIYFHPPYGSTNYPLGSPVSFAESPQGYSTIGVPSDPPIPPSANLHVTDSVSSEPQEMPVPGPDMSYQYMTSQMPSGHMGSQRFDPPMQNYYTETQPRSMSDSYGHSFPQPLSFSSVGDEYREMARQRRRPSNETRRMSKLRARKNRLPSIAETRTSISQNIGSPVDFSPVAPPLSTSYGHGSTERSYRPPRQSTGSSSHGEYSVSGSSAPSYSERAPYQPVYHVPTVNPAGYVGPHQPIGGPMPHNITSMYGPPYPTRPRSPLPPPTSPNPENPPRAVSPRLVDRRERPQCWEHGCNGREFSTFSNLLRHQREKSGTAAKSYCPNCHAEFTRTTARNGHMEHGKCKPRRTSDNP